MSDVYPVSHKDIVDAASRLNGLAVRTPLIENQVLNTRVGGRVLIKPESLQRTGSFKFRGAYNRLSALTETEKHLGVVAFSSGNHAQGVACAAQLLGIKATIVMPADAPTLKTENTRAYGAEVIIYDRYSESREDIAAELAEKSGAIVVPSFDDPYIIAGQGTTGLEMAQDCQALRVQPDQAFICCGGGGLATGSLTALKQYYPELQGYVVEPDGFDDTKQSLLTGAIQQADMSNKSLCDALLSEAPGKMTFPALQAFGTRGITVSDDQAMAAVAFAAKELKLTGEPGGCVALAAALFEKVDLTGKNTLVVISGGNIDPDRHAEAISNYFT